MAATLFYSLAYSQIYDAVGVTPEEVGFAPTQILTHAAAGGIMLVLLVSLATFLVFVPAAPVRDDPASWRQRGSWFRFLLNAMLTGLAFCLLAGLGEATNAPDGLVLLLGGVALLFLVAGGLRIRKRRRWPGIEPRPLRFTLERYSILAAIAVPVGLLFAAIGIFTQAQILRDRLANGVAVKGSEIVGMPFLGVKAEPALVSWVSEAHPDIQMPRCAIYLGRSEGDSVFYDQGSQGTFHVPSASIVVELRGDLYHCDGPVNVRRPSIHTRPDGTLVCRRGQWESFLRPGFTFEWLSRGLLIPVELKKRFGPEMTPDTLRIWSVRSVHCRITALSDFGKARASSESVLVRERGQPLR